MVCYSSFKLPIILFHLLEDIKFIFTSGSICSMYSTVCNKWFFFFMVIEPFALLRLDSVVLVLLKYVWNCNWSVWTDTRISTQPEPARREGIKEAREANRLASGNGGLWTHHFREKIGNASKYRLLVWILAQPLSRQVILGRSLHLSEPLFPHLIKGHYDRCLSWGR